MALLDGVFGRAQARFEDAPSPPPAEDRKRGPRPDALGVRLDEDKAPGEEREEALPPARSHLGRVLDLVG